MSETLTALQPTQEQVSPPPEAWGSLSHIPAEIIILDAVNGKGTAPGVTYKDDVRTDWAKNLSELGPYNQYGGIVTGAERTYSRYEADVTPTGPDAPSSITARRHDIFLEGGYTIECFSELLIESVNANGQTVKERVHIEPIRDGQTPVYSMPEYTRWVEGVVQKGIDPQQAANSLENAKVVAAHYFGLKYDPPKAVSYPLKALPLRTAEPGEAAPAPDPRRSTFDPAARIAVDEKILELQQSGLHGKKLERALLLSLHPDTNTGAMSPEELRNAREQTAYAAALDLSEA